MQYYELFQKNEFSKTTIAVISAFHKAGILEECFAWLNSISLASIFPAVTRLVEQGILRKEVIDFVAQAPMSNRCDIAITLDRSGFCNRRILNEIDELSHIGIYYLGKEIESLGSLDYDNFKVALRNAKLSASEDLHKRTLFGENKSKEVETVERKPTP